MDNKSLKQLRDMMALEIKNALRLLTSQQSTTNHKLDLVYERLEKVEEILEEHTEKLDAQTIDIHHLQDDVKGLWDWTKELKERQERRFKEIREDLGLTH